MAGQENLDQDQKVNQQVPQRPQRRGLYAGITVAGITVSLSGTNVVHQFHPSIPAILTFADVVVILLFLSQMRTVLAIRGLIRSRRKSRSESLLATGSDSSPGHQAPAEYVLTPSAEADHWATIVVGLVTTLIVAVVCVVHGVLGAPLPCLVAIDVAYVFGYYYVARYTKAPRVGDTIVVQEVLGAMEQATVIGELPRRQWPVAVFLGQDELEVDGRAGDAAAAPAQLMPPADSSRTASPGPLILGGVVAVVSVVLVLAPGNLGASRAPTPHGHTSGPKKTQHPSEGAGKGSGNPGRGTGPKGGSGSSFSNGESGKRPPAPAPYSAPRTAEQWCGGDPETLIGNLLVLRSFAEAIAALIEGLGVDHTGCPSLPANTFGMFTVLPLTAVDRGSPFDIVIGPDGLITAVEGDASAAVESHLSEPGLQDVRGMFSDAPPTDPTDRNAFLYVLEYDGGSCDLIARTGSQSVFVDPGRAVSELALQYASDHAGYMSLELMNGYWRETVFASGGRTFVDDIYTTSQTDADDLLGRDADMSTPCLGLTTYLNSEYPYGATQYMSMENPN